MNAQKLSELFDRAAAVEIDDRCEFVCECGARYRSELAREGCRATHHDAAKALDLAHRVTRAAPGGFEAMAEAWNES